MRRTAIISFATATLALTAIFRGIGPVVAAPEGTPSPSPTRAAKPPTDGVEASLVMAALMAHGHDIDAQHIRVEVEGKTIFLRGHVDHTDEKSIAESIAKSVKLQGETVVNELTIGPNPGPSRPTPKN